MRKLVLFSLAAGVMLAPGSAIAIQGKTVDPPIPWEDVPETELKGAASAGATWQRPAPAPQAAPRPLARPVPRPAPVLHQAPRQMAQPAPAAHAAPKVSHHAPAARQYAGTTIAPPQFNRFDNLHRVGSNYHRVDRGWRMPQHWHGPRYRVMNWHGYGFPAPRPGSWWIRYYDDALLIDSDGTVHDSRYGFDWDRYEDRWERDDYGVPYDPDYREDERFDDYDGDYAEYREGPDVVQHGYAGPAYGYGHYGYGWPMVVTETITTTTTGGHGAHHGKHKVGHHQSDCDCEAAPPVVHYGSPPPPPPPSYGERG